MRQLGVQPANRATDAERDGVHEDRTLAWIGLRNLLEPGRAGLSGFDGDCFTG